MSLKRKMAEKITAVYDDVVKLQRDNGQFYDPEDGYTLYKQYTGIYFAVLFTYPGPENSYYRSEDCLERAIKAWDYYYTQTTEEGLTKTITFNQYWYDVSDEWGMYYWMNTIELIKDRIPGQKLEQWWKRIDTALIKIRDNLEKAVKSEEYLNNLRKHKMVANHFVWTVLCYYRYGMIKNNGEMMDFASAVMEDIFRNQTESGTWTEGKSAVVKYAEVTLAAISLFELYSGNEMAGRAIEKSLDYVLNTIYPDFSKMGCVDGRNRYTRSVGAHTAITFFKYSRGIAYLSKWIEYLPLHSDLGRGLQGLAVLTDLMLNMPDDVEYTDEDVNKFIPRETFFDDLMLKVTRKNPWVVSQCLLEQTVFGNRFVLERQNLFDVFHSEKGLLVGGGHSISQPGISCFNVISEGKLTYLHKDGVYHETGFSAVYGENTCRVDFEFEDDEITVKYSVSDLKETQRVYVNIPLPEAYREGFKDKAKVCREICADESFIYKGAEFMVSEEAVLNYPVFPYNSYKQKQRKEYDEAFAVLTVELDYSRPLCRVKIK